MNAHPLEAELVALIERHILDQPRNGQRRIGPSEVGHPCDRRLAYKTLGIESGWVRGIPWKPWIGTSVHRELAMILDLDAMRRFGGGRWHVEQKVTAGVTPLGDLDGSCDLFDEHTGTVVDWKTTSRNNVKEYRRNGPGDTYRVQAHLYGAGWAAKGHHVTDVAVFFLPRDGEWTDRYWWHEPYDPAVATAALDRLTRIEVAATLGPGVLPILSTAPVHCTYCPAYLPGSTELSRGCPGDPASITATEPPATLAHALGNN